MYRAIVIKELRETAWIAGLALVAYALVLVELTGYSLSQMRRESVTTIPFADGRFAVWSAYIAAGLAVLLGLRQSAWETLRGTSVFLLHRPISRRALFQTKLAVGLAVLCVTTGLPLLAYSLWAASPRTHASPFFWSMTANCWIICLAMTAAYLAAFLAGIRNARWFGSRLFPLLAVLFPVAFAATETSSSGASRCVLILAADIVFFVSIPRVVVTRDYP